MTGRVALKGNLRGRNWTLPPGGAVLPAGLIFGGGSGPARAQRRCQPWTWPSGGRLVGGSDAVLVMVLYQCSCVLSRVRSRSGNRPVEERQHCCPRRLVAGNQSCVLPREVHLDLDRAVLGPLYVHYPVVVGNTTHICQLIHLSLPVSTVPSSPVAPCPPVRPAHGRFIEHACHEDVAIRLVTDNEQAFLAARRPIVRPGP